VTGSDMPGLIRPEKRNKKIKFKKRIKKTLKLLGLLLYFMGIPVFRFLFV
jgi:hypothetical protein